MIPKYEIIDHGVDHSQYFQGCGCAFTEFTNCYTGVGNNAKEAYEDAVGMIYSVEGEKADRLKLSKRPRGINAKNKVPAGANEEMYYYVSIRYRMED